MSTRYVDDGLARVISISQPFDYGKSEEYYKLVKSFREQFPQGMRRLHDVCSEMNFALPDLVENSLQKFFDKGAPGFPPACRDVCRWYLRDLFAMDLRLKNPDVSVYDPLIRMMQLGGDFYHHHGELCIREIATFTEC